MTIVTWKTGHVLIDRYIKEKFLISFLLCSPHRWLKILWLKYGKCEPPKYSMFTSSFCAILYVSGYIWKQISTVATPWWALLINTQEKRQGLIGHTHAHMQRNYFFCFYFATIQLDHFMIRSNCIIMETISKLKWEWAGHVDRRTDNRWATRTTFWTPRGKQGGDGRMTWVLLSNTSTLPHKT